jgi:hypothetical protein
MNRTLIDITGSACDTPEIKTMLKACKTLWQEAMRQRNSLLAEKAKTFTAVLKAKNSK